VESDDAGISLVKRHGVFDEAIVDFHDGGVSVTDALRSATSAAAHACDIDDRKDRRRAGHDADMLIVNRDATTHPTDLRSVAVVIVKEGSALDNAAIA